MFSIIELANDTNMTDNLYQTLHAEGLLSNESLQNLTSAQQKPKLFSIHWEIRALLYIGILALTTGLGILVYQNIDTIGQQFILVFIALVSFGSFYYCIKHRQPFQRSKAVIINPYFDYVLLLGCTSMLTFVGYLQYAYTVFGTNYGLATFIPMLVLFGVAYYFDHLGILSMAIVNLALWMGVSVTPKALLQQLDFNNQTIIYTYLILGAILLAAAMFTQRYDFKGHFKFSYQHYGMHVCYIALLAGYFNLYTSAMAYVFMAGIAVLSYFMYMDAYKGRSFYFITLVVLYSYVALSSLVVRLTVLGWNEAVLYLLLMYFISSAIGFVFLLIHLNKKLKSAA